MRVRSSENEHCFQSKLFDHINAYSLQGLLQDVNGKFTAAVEAVEYQKGEKHMSPFPRAQLSAKYIFAEELGIPFYIVTFVDGIFRILRVISDTDGAIRFRKTETFDEKGFAEWWAQIKGKPQRKQLMNGGEARLRDTIFDRVLRDYGLEWGGNIDGFIVSFRDKRIRAIIDNISVSCKLWDERADPARYFSSPNPKHGPRYDGWYAAVKAASSLQVPHLLFTLDKKNPYADHIGCTAIRELSPQGIFYHNNIPPCDHVVNGMDNIAAEIVGLIRKSAPPVLIERG